MTVHFPANILFETSAAFGAGPVVVPATALTTRWRLPSAAMDGLRIPIVIELVADQTQFIEASALYTHAGTSLSWVAADVSDGTNGPGVLVTFSAGAKRVSSIVRAADLNGMVDQLDAASSASSGALGLGSDAVAQVALFAGLGITGSAPVTAWANQLSASGTLSNISTGTGAPALLADGAVRLVQNAAAGRSTLREASVVKLPTNRIALFVDMFVDQTGAGSKNYPLFGAVASNIGFFVSGASLSTYNGTGTDTLTLTNAFVSERVLFGLVIDRSAKTAHFVRMGSVTGYKEWTQTIVAATVADWTAVAVNVTLGNDFATAGRTGTDDFYGVEMFSGVPTFPTDAHTYAVMRGELAELSRRTSAERRVAVGPTIQEYALSGGAGTVTPSTPGFAGLTDIILLTGTAAASFNITVANGSIINQQLRFIAPSGIGAHDIALLTGVDEATVSFSAVVPNDVIDAWWGGVGTGWQRRDLGSSTQLMVFGSGSPFGVVVPERLAQFRYTDTGIYLGVGFNTSAWLKLVTGTGVLASTGVTLGNGATIAVGTHEEIGNNEYRLVRVRHATDPTQAVALTLADGFAQWARILIQAASDQTGQITITRQSVASTINGGASITLKRLGLATCYITFHATSTALATGDLQTAPTSRGATTVSHAADDQREYVITGTQTLPAIASLLNGFKVVFINKSGSSQTINATTNGGDANYTLPSPGRMMVSKDDGSLIGTGNGTTSVVIMDAA